MEIMIMVRETKQLNTLSFGCGEYCGSLERYFNHDLNDSKYRDFVELTENEYDEHEDLLIDFEKNNRGVDKCYLCDLDTMNFWEDLIRQFNDVDERIEYLKYMWDEDGDPSPRMVAVAIYAEKDPDIKDLGKVIMAGLDRVFLDPKNRPRDLVILDDYGRVEEFIA